MKRNKKIRLAVAGAITAGLCLFILTNKVFKSMERSNLLPVKKQAEKVTEVVGSIAQAALQTQKNIAVKEAFPALNEEYELVYANIPIFQFGTTGSYFKDTDIYADLYRKEIWENGKEGVELSLWADRREIWHTIKNGDEKDFTLYPLFWQENSTNITSNQYISYYVIEREDNVYLMRYRMEESDKEVTLSYKVFGIAGNSLLHTASEVPYDADSISFYLVTDGMTEPELSSDGKYFITGNYYSNEDESFLTVKRKATVTLSNKSEINSIGEGAVFTFDSYAKPEEFRNLKNAYPITK